MRYKKRKWFTVVAVTFIVVLIVSVPVWRKLYFRCDEVDIHTGRIRTTRNLLFCQISEKITDSILTEIIGPFDQEVQPNWQRVNKFFLFDTYSPHYTYHGAIAQTREVEMLWQLFSFTDEAKKHIAQTVLDKWQADGNYSGVSMYLRELFESAQQKVESDPEVTISVEDISSIPIE